MGGRGGSKVLFLVTKLRGRKAHVCWTERVERGGLAVRGNAQHPFLWTLWQIPLMDSLARDWIVQRENKEGLYDKLCGFVANQVNANVTVFKYEIHTSI